MSNLANDFYSKLNNTANSLSELDATVKSLTLSGTQAVVSADSSATAVDVVLSAEKYRLANMSQLLIDHTAGSNAVDLLALADASSTANSRAAQIQSNLNIDLVGAAAVLHVVRTGSGTGVIQLEGTEILGIGQTYAKVLIETTSVTASAETVSISRIDGGGYYVESTYTPVMTGSTSGTATATVEVGSYTQVGDRVLFELQLTVDQIATDLAGNLRISLPVAVAADTMFPVYYSGELTTSTAEATSVVLLAESGDAFGTLYEVYRDGTASAPVIDTDVTDNAVEFRVSGQYIV